jgi:predicted signal transduction protein with EAL and GGDEF domain
MLQQVAERFGEVIRPSDTLARLGGDEFALLIEGANESSAVAAARRLLECLSAPVHIAGHQLALDTSIGIALHPGGPGDGEGLVRHADLAMYEAKGAGRGHHEVFRHEMAREFGEVLGLEHEMRQGLEQGEFTVHYQPEIDLDTQSIVGVETLARWTSPTRGVVAPVQFIPIAEATGLIIPLGEFVLNEACNRPLSGAVRDFCRTRSSRGSTSPASNFRTVESASSFRMRSKRPLSPRACSGSK